MLTALKLVLTRLNPHAVRAGLFVLACVFAVLAGTQLVTYCAANLNRWHLGRAEVKSETAHSERTQASQARQTDYDLKAAVSAAERRHLLQTDSILATQEHALRTTRPARIELPADPPRERTSY